MMKFLRKIHTAWGLFVFSVLFLIFFPLLLIPILFPNQFRLVGILNRWWAKLMFIFSFLPFKIEYRQPLDVQKKYIFCPNHFSFLDIPTMGLNPVNTIFVGKIEMGRIPLFGYMYRKLHITVDRRSLKSKFNTLLASASALDEGKSLIIFPEGGIVTDDPPRMGRFKDGAFRTAIEKQIPIVPVTIPFNWLILPDTQPLLLNPGTIHLIFHEPIETTGKTLSDVESLKDTVFGIIETELKKHENR
jgi:1-acyl-sn-glycerol-3-phosphate acyltransferase